MIVLFNYISSLQKNDFSSEHADTRRPWDLILVRGAAVRSLVLQEAVRLASPQVLVDLGPSGCGPAPDRIRLECLYACISEEKKTAGIGYGSKLLQID